MRWFAALVVCASATRAHADVAAAQALYDQAKQLATDGKYAEACPLFDASYKADPQLGVLLNLADCHDKTGKTATAWVEFRAAADLAAKRGDTRESYARDRVAALAPRLDRLRLIPPAKNVPGLVVSRDGADVTALLGTDVPVDPGEHVVEASAPGYTSWTKTVAISGEGTATPLQIGDLEMRIQQTLDIVQQMPPPAPTEPQPRFGGARVFVGSSFDGLASQPGGSGSCVGMFCGSGPHPLPGIALAARFRIRLDDTWSFDPGVGYHYRRVYTEHCVPCVQTADIHLQDLEAFALLRLGLGSHASLLAGAYATVRMSASDPGYDPSASTNPTMFDLGADFALEVFVGRWGGQFQLQYGSQSLSPAVPVAILGFGLSLGVKL